MKPLSEQIVVAFQRRMEWAGVRVQERAGYLRWVRFYLDFCQQYGHPPREESSITPFLAKLVAKNQPSAARWQASQAIHLLLQHGARPTTGNVQPQETCRPQCHLAVVLPGGDFDRDPRFGGEAALSSAWQSRAAAVKRAASEGGLPSGYRHTRSGTPLRAIY